MQRSVRTGLLMSLALGTPCVAQAQENAQADSSILDRVTVRPGGLVQMRYTVNRREPAGTENAWIQGFQLSRVRLTLGSTYDDRAAVYVRAGTDGGGSFRVERALVDLYFGNTTLRVGQFYLPGDAELKPSPDRPLAADYSPTGYTLELGASQGGMAILEPGNWKVSVAATAGMRAGFSQSGARNRADIAGTAYVEYRFVGDHWGPFAIHSSPRGSPAALKAGVGMTHQTGGETGNTDSLTAMHASADVQALGSGWNVLAQFKLLRTTPHQVNAIGTGQDFTDVGFVVQGGAFVSRRVEVFLRYDHVIPDGKARSPGFIQGTGTEDFRTVTGGLDFYLIPGSSLGRLTVDFQYMFDAQSTSIVSPVFNSGVFASTGRQWTLRAQWVVSIG